MRSVTPATPKTIAAGELCPWSEARTSATKTGIRTSRNSVSAFGSCASGAGTARVAIPAKDTTRPRKWRVADQRHPERKLELLDVGEVAEVAVPERHAVPALVPLKTAARRHPEPDPDEPFPMGLDDEVVRRRGVAQPRAALDRVRVPDGAQVARVHADEALREAISGDAEQRDVEPAVVPDRGPDEVVAAAPELGEDDVLPLRARYGFDVGSEPALLVPRGRRAREPERRVVGEPDVAADRAAYERESSDDRGHEEHAPPAHALRILLPCPDVKRRSGSSGREHRPPAEAPSPRR